MPAPAPRPFCIHNETGRHFVELDAISHADAAAQYRERYAIRGYARLHTSDAHVLFDLRTGQLHLVQHTDDKSASQRASGRA